MCLLPALAGGICVHASMSPLAPVCIFLFLKKLFYFWLHWLFVATHGLSLVVAAGATLHSSARASHCSGFSCCGAWALGHAGFSSCGTRAQ